jgi:serine/threonine protein kinase
VGCVLFEMLAGRMPFDGETPLTVTRSHMETPPPDVHTLNADVSPDITAILNRCLAKAQAERFETPETLVAALEELAGVREASEILRPGASAAVTLEGDELASDVAPVKNSRLGGMMPAVTVASLSTVLTVLIISALGIVDRRFWEDSQLRGYSSVTGPSTPQNPPVFTYSSNVIDTPEVVRVSLTTSGPIGATELVITSLAEVST